MTKDSITLDNDLGINCRMTMCARCGGDGEELLLLGNKNFVATCRQCGAEIYGCSRGHREVCPKCRGASFDIRKLTDYERVPTLCQKCQDEIANFNKIIAEGGLPFKCDKCGAQGVLKKSKFTDNFKQTAFDNGAIANVTDVVGVNFGSCVEHTVEGEKE